MSWFETQYPDAWAGISWLNSQNAKCQMINDKCKNVIVEADGDSYTDYDSVSAFTGLPTVVGWAVHEWLWRGSYNVVAPRRQEVEEIYESTDLTLTRQLLAKYHVTYVIVGTFERQKFKALDEAKFNELGTLVFRHGDMAIYQIH